MAMSTHIGKVTQIFARLRTWFHGLFFSKPEAEIEVKPEFNFRRIKIICILGFFIFIVAVFLMPDDPQVEFAERIDQAKRENGDQPKQGDPRTTRPEKSVAALWGAPAMNLPSGSSGGAQVNYNTSMLLGAKNGNAKTQLRAGLRLPIRLLDKTIVSQEPVPVLGELLLDSVSDSGLRLPAGTRLYGEASFRKGSDRAEIRFRQISLPNGRIMPVSGSAIGKDGQSGVLGRVFSDGVKNTTGQLITTFVAGLAAGSMETDLLGRSKGGVENGLLAAVSTTAKERAQSYGEKLKAEREWIEIPNGVECDTILSESLNLQLDTIGGEP